MELKNLTEKYFKGILKRARAISKRGARIDIGVRWEEVGGKGRFLFEIEWFGQKFTSYDSFEECLEKMGRYYKGEG